MSTLLHRAWIREMGENLSEACVSPVNADQTTSTPANQGQAEWQYNYNIYQMAAAAATYQQQQAQQYNAYRAHVQQYAMQQMNNQQTKPNNAPPGFSNAVIPPPPPTLMDIKMECGRPQQQNQKQFGGIRFNLNNQQKRLQNSPLNASPQTVGQQMQNSNGSGKKKRKRNKNKQQHQQLQQQQQQNNFQNTNNSLAASPSLPDMSIPPPVIVSPITANAKQLSSANLSQPPPLHNSNYSLQSQQSPVQTKSSAQNFQSQSELNTNPTPTQILSPNKKSETFHSPTDAWPDSLNNYVARCYAKCKTNFDKDQIDICLKGRITAAANRGELWTKDWDAEPTPSVHSERNNIVPKPPVPGQLASFQNATASAQSAKKGISQSLGQRLGNRANGKRTSSSRSRSPYTASSHNNRKRRSRSSSCSSDSVSPRRKSRRSSSSNSSDDNYKSLTKLRASKTKMSSRLGAVNILAANATLNSNNKKNKNKKFKNKRTHPDLIRGDIISDAERLQQRAARFTETKKQMTSAPMANGKKKHAKQHRLFVDDTVGNLDLIDFHIVGTCRDIEKSFLRLTKAPAASEVRPAEVLVFSLANVKSKWTEKKDYFYACDQLKSIRQDLTVSSHTLLLDSIQSS